MNRQMLSAICTITVLTVAGPATGEAATISVDCNAGGKLQTALNAVASGDTILVTGVCNESVSIRDELVRVTIDGQGTTVLHGSSTTATVMQVLGRNITIRNLTITGGRSGIGILRGGSALVDANTIQESGTGIVVHQNGHARIVNNTIQLNAVAGITVWESSIARIGYLDNAGPVIGNVVRDNAGPGVTIQRGSAAVLLGNTISGNDGPGVLVRGGSHADLSGNDIAGNGSDAVVVTVNSDVQLGDQGGIFDAPNGSTTPNDGYGISCSLNSTLAGSLGTLAGLSGARKFDSTCSNGQKIEVPQQ